MDNIVYLNNLYDIYFELLTEKQRRYFEDYYFNNLSYGEIGLSLGVSRNAVYKELKNTCDKLIDLENKLKIFDKKCKINDIIELVNNKEIEKSIEILENLF